MLGVVLLDLNTEYRILGIQKYKVSVQSICEFCKNGQLVINNHRKDDASNSKFLSGPMWPHDLYSTVKFVLLHTI